MGLFYQGLGMILMYTGSILVTNVISGYETPEFPVSISLALSSGLLEESMFFGIPYYMTGNPYILLGTGITWSATHLFSTGMFSFETLSYEGFLFTIPYMFFTIRVWISNKGWFAITFHSGWNFAWLCTYCMLGLRQCSIFNDVTDIINLIMSISAGMIVYIAHENKKRTINRFLYLVPAAAIMIAVAMLFSMEITF